MNHLGNGKRKNTWGLRNWDGMCMRNGADMNIIRRNKRTVLEPNRGTSPNSGARPYFDINFCLFLFMIRSRLATKVFIRIFSIEIPRFGENIGWTLWTWSTRLTMRGTVQLLRYQPQLSNTAQDLATCAYLLSVMMVGTIKEELLQRCGTWGYLILRPKDLMRMLTLGMSRGRRICAYATLKTKIRSSTVEKAFGLVGSWAVNSSLHSRPERSKWT